MVGTQKLTLALFLSLIALIACQDGDKPHSGDPQKEAITVDERSAYKGMLRMKLNPAALRSFSLSTRAGGTAGGAVETGLSRIDELSHRLGATRMERTFPYSGENEWKAESLGMHLWYDVYFDENVPVTRAVNDFNLIDDIETVEAVYRIRSVDKKTTKGNFASVTAWSVPRPMSVPFPFDDPNVGLQWHYQNDGSLARSIAGCDINLFAAWGVTTGHPDVIVAVVDGGIDYTHEDLQDNIWLDGNGKSGYNFVDNNTNIIPHDHGTHVAGTIAAVNNNGKGVAGVAGGSGNNDGVRLMSCQIFKPHPTKPGETISTTSPHLAIRYGADHGAVICQNSWGYDIKADGSSPALSDVDKAAIDYFIQFAGTDGHGNQTGPMKRGLVIFAAGNEGKEYVSYPAAYEPVVAVTSMGTDFIMADYSNYGTWVDVTAPGGNATYGTSNCIYSTLPNNEYGYMEGTSMACPHVSGVAALLISKFGVGNPGFTANDLRKMLLASTRNIYTYNDTYRGKMGVGYIDAFMAFNPPINNAAPTFSMEAAGTIVLREYQQESITFTVHDPEGHWWKVTDNSSDASVYTSVLTDTSFALAIDASLKGIGDFTIDITVTDQYDAPTTLTIPYTILPNAPPQIVKAFENMYIGKTGESKIVYLTDYFFDEDEEPLNYTVTSSIAGLASTTVNEGSLTVQTLKSGLLTLTVVATDFKGESVSQSFLLMSRDDTQAIDLYPNPAVKVLNIRMGENVNGQIQVCLYSAGGAKVLEQNLTISPFSPATLDLSKLQGGAYNVVVKEGNREIKRNIVKL
ncbi:hypothetical protein FACS1894199_15230 [Bacteroidia bacterium]|nr:hypothetical protein FACS1894199_15230 [Bacteroidia bacterium]